MGACAAILKGSESFSEEKKKARESFKQSNESWVYEQTKKKKDLVSNLQKRESSLSNSFGAIPEDEELSLTDMNEMRLQLGEETALEQHDHELLGESEDLCKEDQSFTQPHHKITKTIEETTMIQKCLSTHFLFSSLSEKAIELCIDEMERETLEKGTTVFEKEHNDKFYIIVDGKVECVRPDGNSNYIPNESGERGFGDIALMVDIPANAVNKITVVEKAHVFTLHRLQFHRIAIEQTRRETERLLSILGRVELFKRKLTDEQMEDLADHLISVTFEDGDTIVKEGTIGKNFYIVESGSVNVHKGKDMEPIATLAHDSFFGDQSLLADKPRTHTCVAKGKVTCLAIGKETFQDLFMHIRERFNSVHTKREKEQEQKKLKELAKTTKKDFAYEKVIGKGSFGLVYLARRKGAASDSTPFAVKQIEKDHLVQTGQQFNVVREKLIMHQMSHPHIASLFSTYSDARSLYFVMEYLAGGHVYHWLWKSRLKFDLERTQYYAACISDSLIYMHSKNILYRDLKLENMCLNHEGRVKLIDFGLSKVCTHRTFTTAGTPEYMAPEMINGRGHHKGVDYWAMGIAIFEMLCGFTAFGMWVRKKPPSDMLVFRRINSTEPKFPAEFPDKARGLIEPLLRKKPAERLGCLKTDGEGIREKEFFEGIDWKKIGDGSMTPPWTPPIKNINDNSCHMDALDKKWKGHKAAKYKKSGRRFEKLWDQNFPLGD